MGDHHDLGGGDVDAPHGASSLLEILDAAARQGHRDEFVAVRGEDGPMLRCPHCEHLTPPAAVDDIWAIRLEGASDPGDMAYVVALRCERCGDTGIYVSRYGPEVGELEAEVLPLLPEPGSPSSAPDRH